MYVFNNIANYHEKHVVQIIKHVHIGKLNSKIDITRQI